MDNIHTPVQKARGFTFHMKTAPQEIMECHACCMKVMARGDHKGWKGVQMKPNDALSFRWYCNKTACQEKYDEALAEAQAAWVEWSEEPEGE